MHKSFGRLFLATLATAATIITPLAGHAAGPGVVISEIGWAGSSLATIDEWVELTNLSDEAVDVGGWTLVGAASSGGALTIPDGSTIEPHNTFLISNYANGDAKSTINVTPSLVTSSVSLSNSALALSLRDRDGIARDAAGDGSVPARGRVGGGSDGGRFVAMVRTAETADGALATSWADATEASGFTAEATELGTPGTIEGWFVPAAEIAVAEEIVAAEEPAEEAVTPEIVEAVEDAEITETVTEPVETAEAPGVPISIPEIVGSIEPEVQADAATEASEPPAAAIEPVEPMTETITEEIAPAEAVTEIAGVEAEPAEVVDVSAESATTVTETVEANTEPEVVTQTVSSDSTPETVASDEVAILLINEFVSDAAEEWIEILNSGNTTVNLSGWTVRDASGKETSVGEQELAAAGTVVVYGPAGKLNNDGDTVELVDPSGAVVDAVTYGTGGQDVPGKTESLARAAGGEWEVTATPTPGSANVVTASAVVETKKEETETVKKEEAAIWSGAKTLRISEIYPNTSGGDATEEFIRLENTGTETVDLKDWKIADASGRAYQPDDSLTIAPGASLTLSRTETHIALNNTEDTVTVTAPDGSTVDTRSYEKPPKGSSFVLVGTEWIWSGTSAATEPSDVPKDAVSAVTTAKASSISTSKPSTVAAQTRVEGTVLVVPGVLGTQIFYVGTETGGMQIYQYDASFPEMIEGDRVVATGTMTESRGEARLKVSKDDAITVVGEDAARTPEDATIAELTEEDHGRLVRVLGTVLVRSGKTITLEHEGSQLAVRVADGTDIDLAAFARGKELNVTGILVAASGKLTLLPRSPDDIAEVAAETTEAFTPVALSGKDARDEQDRNTAMMITAGVVLVLAAYSARKLIPNLKLLYARYRALRVASQAAH